MSVVYAVKCSCGATLKHSCSLDYTEDLIVEVKSCEACKKEAYENGREDAENELATK